MASIDLQAALEPALIILEGGGTTEQAERALRQMLSGICAPAWTSTWRLDSLTVTFIEADGAQTTARPVAPVGLNLRRVVAASDLATGVEAGEIGPEAIRAEIDRIRTVAGPPAWQVVVAASVAAGAFSQTMMLNLGLAAVAFASGFVGQIVRTVCQRRGLSRVAATAACTLVSAMIATAALRLGLSIEPGPTLIASIIYAAPGMLLINGFIDLTTERYLFVGLQRLLHAGLLFLVMTLSVFVADALL